MSWQDKLRQVEPYVAGEQPKISNMIKLNTNENPYGPSNQVKEVLKEIDIEKLKLYPNSDGEELRHALADYHGLKDNQVFLGNGSDEVLALTFLTFFNGKEPVLFPNISYSFYPVYCDLYQMSYKEVLLDQDFKINVEDFKQPNSGIIFPNPNAPTGAFLSLDVVEDIIKHNQNVVVIVDEAYIDFGGDTAKELTRKYDNVLVVQTYSKSRSLAGLRIGYAIGNKELIKAMNDVKYSYNSYTMNEPSIVLGTAVLEDEEYFQETRKKIIETREWFQIEMRKIGFNFADSKANFIFATHERVPAKEIFEAAKKAKIYVRYFDQPRIDNYLRITIGTRKEMETLLDFLKEFTAQ